MSVQRRRVLLIVDDLGVVWPARHALEAAGYEVRWYGDAKAALNALDTFAPELVIVDVMLPGGGGWTVVDTIRALPQEERPKLLVISEAVGFEQTSRIEGLGAEIDPTAWTAQPIFELVADAAGLKPRDLFPVLNMGIGMALVVPPERAGDAIQVGRAFGDDPVTIGRVVDGAGVRFA